jgi:hypothetical protein
MLVRYLANASVRHGYEIVGVKVEADTMEVVWRREANRAMVDARINSGSRFLDSEFKPIPNPGVDEVKLTDTIGYYSRD